MKKTATLLLVLLLPLISLAQRHADLELIMVSPGDSLEVLEEESFEIDFAIKNHGPDTITWSDTVNVQWLFDGYPIIFMNGSKLDSFEHYTQVIIAPRDSFTISIPSFGTNMLRGHDFCIKAILVNSVADPIADTNITNDMDCSYIYFTPTAVNSVSQEKITKVYPIPAKGILNWEAAQFKPQQIAMYDMNGRIVYKTIPMANKGQIDVTGFAKGLYFIRIAGEGNNFFSQKLMIE